MTRLALWLIARAAPPDDREWILGDTLEELDLRERTRGPAAARRWLRGEARRVLLHALRERAARRWRQRGRRSAAHRRIATPHPKGDRMMSALWQDVRYASRLLSRTPGFTIVAGLTLALGLGANIAMFAVVNAVLLKPLPFRDADRLMLVHRMVPDREAGAGIYRDGVWSMPKYLSLLELQTPFDESALFATRDVNIAGAGDPSRAQGEVVSERYPALLGISPILGRAFTADEARQPGAAPVAMIGHDLWAREFQADPAILGRVLQVNGAPYTIVGVLPRGFRGLSGRADLWAPLAVFEPTMLSQRQNHSYTLVARRRAAISEAAAIAVTRTYGAPIDEEPGEPASPGLRAVSLTDSRADTDIRRVSWIVLGAVSFVLLIACVNLTNLLAAKAIGRRREMAIRGALGASRGRLARQLGVEGLLLAGLGAAGGLAVAWLLLAAAGALLPDSEVFFRTPVSPGTARMVGAAGLTQVGASMIGFDAATLLFTCGLTLVTGLLVTLMPAIQGSAQRPGEMLKAAGTRAGARGLHAFGARSALVVAQIALALVLLAGAGLMIRSAARLQATSIGISADRVLTARIDLPRPQYSSEGVTAFYGQLVDRLRAVPGVSSVGLSSCAPVSGGCSSTSLWFPPNPYRGDGTDPLVGIYWATPEYFTTLGTRLLRGRAFTADDRAGRPKVAMVSETAARTLWPQGDPIGKTIAVGQGGFNDGATVIGIVSDIRYRSLEAAAVPDVYVPFAQSSLARMRLFVRSDLDTASLVSAIRRETRALDPFLPLSEIKTMEERVGDAMWRTRVSAWLLAGFATLALLLTAIGVFGVMAQTVAHRTAEIGIRVALGAQRRDVIALVLGRASLVTAAGLALGLAGTLALTRLIASLLFEVTPNDPSTLGAVALLLAAVAFAACYVPIRRATRVDAIVALRTE